MKYKALFFDIDDTIFDFSVCSKSAILKAFDALGIKDGNKNYKIFKQIDDTLWEQQKLGFVSVKEVMNSRFEILAEIFKFEKGGAEMKKEFQKYFAQEYTQISHASEVLESLSRRFKLYAASNGVLSTQIIRLAQAALLEYFEDLFVSDNIGFDKPDTNFFKSCLERSGFEAKEILMIGDSLRADIKGATACGIDTCWYNPNAKPIIEGTKPNFIITDLRELPKILSE